MQCTSRNDFFFHISYILRMLPVICSLICCAEGRGIRAGAQYSTKHWVIFTSRIRICLLQPAKYDFGSRIRFCDVFYRQLEFPAEDFQNPRGTKTALTAPGIRTNPYTGKGADCFADIQRWYRLFYQHINLLYSGVCCRNIFPVITVFCSRYSNLKTAVDKSLFLIILFLLFVCRLIYQNRVPAYVMILLPRWWNW